MHCAELQTHQGPQNLSGDNVVQGGLAQSDGRLGLEKENESSMISSIDGLLEGVVGD